MAPLGYTDAIRLIVRIAFEGVLRGGSFNKRAENLRSTNRNRNRAENRNQNNGFRCARGPRRQP